MTQPSLLIDPAQTVEFPPTLVDTTAVVTTEPAPTHEIAVVNLLQELEPGAYYGVPEEVYHALPYVSSSYLKKFKSCPADALMAVEKTACMELGSALHCYILEGEEEFEKKYVVMFESELNKNTKEYKQMASEFAAANADKTILPSLTAKMPTMDVIKGVQNRLRNHPAANYMLSQEGLTEVTLIWDDPKTGLRCKARLDFFAEGIIVDLKKTADAQKFRNTLVNLNYDIQSAWYLAGAQACALPATKFAFIAMEAEAPFKVATGFLSDRWAEYGRKEIDRLLGLVKQCLERNYFPAYEIPGHIESLDQITGSDLMLEWDMPSWR